MRWYYCLKSWFILKFFPITIHYTVETLYELKGTELFFCSDTLRMNVYISKVAEKGITLMGRWYDKDERKYEDEDSVIFCINRNTCDYDIDAFLKKINESVFTGIWLYKCPKAGYVGGGRIDNSCAFK
jgi:hypothetical protein